MKAHQKLQTSDVNRKESKTFGFIQTSKASKRPRKKVSMPYEDKNRNRGNDDITQ